MQSLRYAFLSRRFSQRWPWAAVAVLSLGTVLVVTMGSWQGCAIYGPDLLLNGPRDAGGADVEDANTADSLATCAHVSPPPRPDNDASANTNDFAVVGAMQAIDVGYGFGTLDAGAILDDASAPVALTAPLAPYGWDLDKVCTCQGSPPAPPSCAQAAGTVENCDDDAGRDHIALEIFRALGVTAENGSLTANAAMQAGQYGLLIQILGYNGQSNDGQVTVAIYASNGIDGVQDGGAPKPQHMGNDKWTVDPRYIMNGDTLAGAGTDCDTNPSCMAIYSDPDAYVASGVMVAHFGTVPLTFGSRADIGGALMQLLEVYLVGDLVETPIAGSGLGWAIRNGSISGRWLTSQLLGNLSTIPDLKNPGMYFCGRDPFYPTFKQGICALQDIAHSQTYDNQNPLAPCDALSMSFGFVAEPARLGPILAVAPAAAGCFDDAGNPWHDTCP